MSNESPNRIKLESKNSCGICGLPLIYGNESATMRFDEFFATRCKETENKAVAKVD